MASFISSLSYRFRPLLNPYLRFSLVFILFTSMMRFKILKYHSHGQIPASTISPYSQNPHFQNQRIPKVRDGGQIPAKEARLQRHRYGILLRQQRFCPWIR